MVLDTRAAAPYSSAHVPGSVQIGLGGQFAAWAGAVLGLDREMILVADDDKEAALVADARKVVEDATDWAESQADPDPATAQQNVYADMPPARMDDPLWTGARFIGDGGPWGVRGKDGAG